jgi:hypothetical protein
MPLDDTSPSTQASPKPAGGSFSDMLRGEMAREKGQEAERSGQIKQIGEEITKSHEDEKRAIGALPKPFNLSADEYKQLFSPAPVKYNNPYEGFGAIASQLAVLGSAFTKRPLINALNAATAGMNAMKQGDMEATKAKFDEWKANRDLALKVMEFQNTAYKEQLQLIKEGGKENRDDARAHLQLLAAQFHDPILQNAISMGHLDIAEQHLQILQGHEKKFNEQADHLEQGYHITNELMDAGKAYRAAQQGGNPEIIAAAKRRYDEAEAAKNDYQMAQKGGGAAEFSPSKEYVIHDKDGKVVDTFLGREDKAQVGKIVRADTGAPIKLEPGQSVHVTTPGAGRQQAAQLTAIRGAGNEAVASLKNLVELPISANAGVLMGVQYATPDEMSAALARSLARQFTPDDVRALYISFAGVGRSLAQLEAQGRAQGLVGLSNQMDRLMPQSGDTPIAVMRRYAEIRQIIDRSMENAKVSGGASPEAMALFDRIAAEAKEAVPYTVHDVNRVEFGGQQGVKEFAEKIFKERHGGEAAAGLPSDAVAELKAHPTPERQRQFDEAFGPGSAKKSLGQ